MVKEAVFDTLHHRTNARLLADTPLAGGMRLSYWGNSHDRVTYNTDAVHTLSIYTHGGYQTRRLDRDCGTGKPGCLCLIPQHQVSRWSIDGPSQFVHLYFSDRHFKYFVTRHFDVEPRQVNIPDLTFFDDRQLRDLGGALLRAAHAGYGEDPLAFEQLTCTALGQLVSLSRRLPDRALYKGGLGPRARKRVLEFVEAHLAHPLRLADLAREAGLSEFHFARAFKTSLGITPHEYLNDRRMEKARQLIARGGSLADVAVSCGFSSQSHFNRQFHRAMGMPPGRYRTLLQ